MGLEIRRCLPRNVEGDGLGRVAGVIGALQREETARIAQRRLQETVDPDVVADAETVNLIGRCVRRREFKRRIDHRLLERDRAGSGGAHGREIHGAVLDGDAAGKAGVLGVTGRAGRVVGRQHELARTVHDQRSGAGQAGRIAGAGDVGNDAGDRDGLIRDRSKSDRLSAVNEEAAAIAVAVGGTRSRRASGHRAQPQRAAVDRQRAALLDEDIAAGAETTTAGAAAAASTDAGVAAAETGKSADTCAETAAATAAKAAVAAAGDTRVAAASAAEAACTAAAAATAAKPAGAARSRNAGGAGNAAATGGLPILTAATTAACRAARPGAACACRSAVRERAVGTCASTAGAACRSVSEAASAAAAMEAAIATVSAHTAAAADTVGVETAAITAGRGIR